MTRKLLYISVLALLVRSLLYLGMANAADEHSAAALRHASEAADSNDSQSVGDHAAQALAHIEEAKASASSTSAEDIHHIEAGAADLDAAVKHAKWYNTNSAIQHATDGKAHLEAPDK